MWFGKIGLKAAALVLVGVASSAFAQGPSPMNISADDWNYLSNFKLWGTNGISFGNRPEFYNSKLYNRSTNENDYSKYNGVLPDTLGWVGTADGNLTTGEKGWLDGPIIVGGSITSSGNKMRLITGPVRTKTGNIAVEHRGTTCVGNNSTGDCSYDKVPQIRSDLSVPGLEKGTSLSGSYSVSGRTVLDVGSYCSGNDICNIYFDHIDFANDSRLVVQMPAEGRPTRIFVNKLNFGTHPEIVVAYKGKGELKQNEYDGNLLFYVDSDVTFANIDNVEIMGTIVSTGTIRLVCNIVFAGQLIANKIEVGNEIQADKFVFKKFDPKIELFVGNKSKTFKESNTWESIDVVLSDKSKNDVKFSYCFQFDSEKGVSGKFAGYVAEKEGLDPDVGAKDASHAFPICNKKESKEIIIPAGSTKAEGIYIKPLIDGIVETDEAFWFQITKVEGAETTSDYEKGLGYKIYIVSNDEKPTVSSALVANVDEDTEYKFSKDDFKFKHSTRTFASVIITDIPDRGTFLYDGKAVTKNTKITVANLSKLTYQAAADDFGDGYASFGYQVVGSGTGDNTSIVYPATINVIPVNDKPSAKSTKFTFTVPEEPAKNAVIGNLTYKDVTNELTVDEYSFSIVSGSGDATEFAKKFVLSADGTIKVNGTQTFSYYDKPSYTIKATVSDNAATEKTKKAGPLTSDPFTIVISVQNQNHAPTISDQSFELPEKNKTSSGVVDWTSSKVVGNVAATDPDGDNLTYKVVDTGIPFAFRNGTKSLIVSDGSVLDYETKKSWSFVVSVTDPSGASNKATITVVLTDVNEPPEPRKVLSEYQVDENTSTGTSFGTFEVFDNDASEKLTYVLTGALTGAVNESKKLTNKTLADIFTVEESANKNGLRTVSIKVKDEALLDYEELYKTTSSKNATYNVKITITDAAKNSVPVETKIAVQDVNEEPWIKDGKFYVYENAGVGEQVCAEFETLPEGTPDYTIPECEKFAKVDADDIDIYNRTQFGIKSYETSPVSEKTYANDYKSFYVDASGNVRIASGAKFDYKTRYTYKFKVIAKDGGDLTAEAEITVIIKEVKPVPEIKYVEGTVTVPENSTSSYVNNDLKFSRDVLSEDNLKTLGLDKDPDITLYFSSEISVEKFKDMFTITEEKGTIKPSGNQPLDYEALYSGNPSKPGNDFDIQIKIDSDNGNSVIIVKHIAIVDVNEESEITEFGPYSVGEDIAGGAFVGTIVATDPDFCTKTKSCDNGKHPNGFNKLHYFVDEVIPVDGSMDFPFELNEATGEITLKKGEKLRHSKQQQYVFVVRVRDSSTDSENPPISVREKVTINVEDVNEPSEFKVLADLYEVDENTDIGTKFGDEIVIYDEDVQDQCNKTGCPLIITIKDITIKDNGKCTAGKNCAEDLFQVVNFSNTNADNETSFKFEVKKGLDYEALYPVNNAIFDVKLTVTDKAGNKVSQDTKIRVNDVNEKPEFMGEPYKFTVSENTKTEQLLGVIDGADPDTCNPSFGTLYFSLEGDEAKLFEIDQKSGELYVVNNANLDYETKSVYEFYAIATDKKFTIKTLVTVNIKDEDEGPEFPTVSEYYVDENTPKGTAVTLKDGTKKAVVASDDDCKNNKACKTPIYTLEAADGASDDYKSFSIDKDGFITVAKDNVLNYEEQDKYVVRVVATDGSNSKLSDFVDVTIHINDVNDAPIYDKKEYVFDVDENEPADEVVGSVFASDEDSWSELTFTLTDYEKGSKDSDLFTINSSGRIVTKGKLNYEDKKVYEVWATVTDNGHVKGFDDLSTTVKVTINVNDKPDDPIIEDDGKAGYGIYEVTVENPTSNGSIAKDTKDGKDVCYEVKDEDADQTKNLTAYVTDEGNTDADRLFGAVVEKDGSGYKLCLTLKDVSRLDYESLQHEHHIKIAVMDADKRTAAVEKTISLVDVNEMPIISGNSAFSFYDQNDLNKVIGKLYSDDIDTSKKFTDNVFTLVGGDTDLFKISEDGKIYAKKEFEYQEESKHTFELEIALSDRDSKNYPKLTTKTTVTLTLKNTPKIPTIKSEEFTVDENSEGGTVIGVIEAEDLDGDGNLLFKLEEESPYVEVSVTGSIIVREGAVIDYEKMQEFTILVSVQDVDAQSSEKEILIKVNDLNEKPTIKEQKIVIPEDTKPGTTKGPIEAEDPDKKKEFNELEFYLIGDSDEFEVKKNGEIVVTKSLDYETKDSYTIQVRVVDPKGLSDTATVTIEVGNVIEKSEVEITRVEAGDSVYIKPPKDSPIYTNKEVILVEWKQDGVTKSSYDTLKVGCQEIIKKFKAPNKDVEGADTIEVCYSTAAPIVEVDATKTKVEADNIYTIVEEVDKKDSSIYVNKKTKEVTVTVKDTVLDYEEKFNVEVVLDTIAVSNKTVQTMVDVSKSSSKPSLSDKPKEGVSETPINGDKTQVSFKKTVNGTEVTVSYDVDDNGDIIKLPVVNDKGEKVMTEVITVSTVVEVGGKDVVVSYKADAKSGNILYGDSEGNLVTDVPSSSDSKKSDEVNLKTGVGAFNVTYDFKGVEGNKATVSYVIDEKGKVVANEEGDRGYLVTYTYTNKYGNSADKSVFMVLDKLAPIVKILSPVDGQVVYANFVDVDWCIAVDGDEDNCVKQDTLNFQSLEKGVNTIKRIYRDKAGNETIAKIDVMMKKAKDVNITLEKPMVIVSKEDVDKYYDSNPPEEDEKYAVSILNPTSQKEKEIVVGTTEKTKKGSGDEPYPGYDGHLGPTIKIDMKVPLVSAVGGLATLDDIIINGNMVALDGVDAKDSKKVTVKDYIEEYCSEEFKENLGKDYSKATLYSTNANVKLWFFTTSGQFVDKYQFDYDVNDPEYVDKAGLVKFFFEMKLDNNGELRDKNGRLYGTGPFIVKTKVDLRSKLRCTVPPVDGNAKYGDVIKSSDELLTRFGYRRPVLRGNEKASEKSSKNSKSSNKKSDSKSSKK